MDTASLDLNEMIRLNKRKADHEVLVRLIEYARAEAKDNDFALCARYLSQALHSIGGDRPDKGVESYPVGSNANIFPG